jgi:hypothetical protein
MLRKIKLLGVLYSVLILVLSLVAVPANGQHNIRVQGKITDISTGDPIAAVNVIVGGYVVAYSDIDGNYSCTIPHEEEIIFYSPQYEEVRVKINNRQVINVQNFHTEITVHVLEDGATLDIETSGFLGTSDGGPGLCGNLLLVRPCFYRGWNECSLSD